MKSSTLNILNSFFLSALALLCVLVILVSSCKKDNLIAQPKITSVRNYEASPLDTIVKSITPGQWVVIQGQNLRNAIHIRFDGVDASFNYGLFADDKAVVQIPSVIPFNSVPAELQNTITYVTNSGTTTYQLDFSYLPPVITGINNETFFPGDSIYLYGSGFYLPLSINFAGANITNYITDSIGTRIGFVCPPVAEVPGGIITVVAKGGTVSTTKSYSVGKPSIISISNENPAAGDSVYIYGAAFKDIQAVTFAGSNINSYNVAPDYSRIAFQCPALSSSDVVTVTTLYGSASTIFNVNDITTGALANFEWSGPFGWQWWGGSSLTVADPNISGGWINVDQTMAGNTGMFQELKSLAPMDPDAGADWSTAIRINAGQWIPAANLSDDPANWALKFEMNVPSAWNGPTLAIKSGVGGTLYRYEPWSTASGPVAFTSKGWVTITIPLSSFRTNSATLGDGKGAPITNLTTLVGASGSTELYLYMHNFSTAASETGYYAGFDNMRVVKIK